MVNALWLFYFLCMSESVSFHRKARQVPQDNVTVEDMEVVGEIIGEGGVHDVFCHLTEFTYAFVGIWLLMFTSGY